MPLDDVLEDRRASLQGSSREPILDMQVLNDQAYFLPCWGQLENEINLRCRNAIRWRRNDASWQIRRAWDLYGPDDSRLSGLSFDDRVKLVLDQQEGRGSPYAIAVAHYGIRNRIAHGQLEWIRIAVLDFIKDCCVIQAAPHRAT